MHSRNVIIEVKNEDKRERKSFEERKNHIRENIFLCEETVNEF